MIQAISFSCKYCETVVIYPYKIICFFLYYKGSRNDPEDAERVISMTAIQYLNLLKTCSLIFLGGDILLFAFDHKVLGVIVLFSELVLMWRLYRCPNCRHSLDERVSLRDVECCPYCGYDFHKMRKEN